MTPSGQHPTIVPLYGEMTERTLYSCGKVTYILGDCFEWLQGRKTSSIHGVVTDPPFALEYSQKEVERRNNGNKGGVWRLPPSFDGYKRQPVPRFTALTTNDLEKLARFFAEWGALLYRPLVPGAHVLLSSNPLVAHVVADALEAAGLERRGTIIRTVRTMRGGDRPKDGHEKFPEVSVIPKSYYEPWLLFRKPLEGRIRDNLEKWGTGALRRPEEDRPFDDLIVSRRTPARERAVAPHWSLKPQAFLRQIVRAILPLGSGTVADTFAGSGSTLAAAAAIGYRAVGIERDPQVAVMAPTAIPALKEMDVSEETVVNGNTDSRKIRQSPRTVRKASSESKRTRR